jgi:Ran GTPase-activating protein (RanGAP) involved in mRNA processing and transport
LKHCQNIREVDFSDIFTKRLRNTLPMSLKVLIDAIKGKNVLKLNVSHNAFGPDGVRSI